MPEAVAFKTLMLNGGSHNEVHQQSRGYSKMELVDIIKKQVIKNLCRVSFFKQSHVSSLKYNNCATIRIQKNDLTF